KQDLLIHHTATPFAMIHNNSNGIGNQGTGMWDRGYNYNPSSGFGLWDGTSGITSATARASHQNDARISVGYIDGGVQNDPNIGDLGIGLATNRIKIRPSLNGDLNLDGVVDGNDIGIIIGLGYFGTGSAPHGWLDGDINGDGQVDANDIGIIIGAGTFNNGSFAPAAAQAIQTPEPSTLALIGIATTGVLARRRKRR